MTLVIILIVAGFLFSLAFITKRRFGVLGLGLAAGTVLADSITAIVADYLEKSEAPVAPLSYDTTAIVLLTILPALLLLLGGPTYGSKRATLIGGGLFAALATLLILGPLTTSLPTSDEGVRQVLLQTAKWQDYIIAGGIAIAIGDMLLMRAKPPADPKSKH